MPPVQGIGDAEYSVIVAVFYRRETGGALEKNRVLVYRSREQFDVVSHGRRGMVRRIYFSGGVLNFLSLRERSSNLREGAQHLILCTSVLSKTHLLLIWNQDKSIGAIFGAIFVFFLNNCRSNFVFFLPHPVSGVSDGSIGN